MEEKSPSGFKEVDVHTLYEKYCKGTIFGLPGAGKTTILRHLAFKEFNANEAKADNCKQVVIFVPCRDIPLYDEWYKTCYSASPSEPDPEAVLEFMTWVFLFGGKDDYELTPDQWVEFQNAGQKVKQAFKEKRLTLLVDALDEAADIKTRERIKQLFLIVHGDPLFEGNRLYLTSRPSETIHFSRDFSKENIPVFKVLNLDMEQVRAVARQLMDPDSAIYEKFDDAIWKEEIVVKMAATPITALLVTAYFQAYEKFHHRYPMYDLLLKFILLKVWDNIKTGAFPFKNLELFFREIKEPGFFDRHKETRIFYGALASLCFDLFYGDVDGVVQRSVNEETLMIYFTRFIRENLYYYDKETAEAEAAQWKERFHRDHLLLQAGKREYVFVHSTVMEFLAAYYMVQQYQKDNKRLAELVRKSMIKEAFLELETLPVAAGSSLITGYDILANLRDLVSEVEYSQTRVFHQGAKCLAEVEWLLYKAFQSIRLERLRSPLIDIMNRNWKAVQWTYEYLQDSILTEDKEQLKEQVQQFDNPLKLSQKTFLEEYLDYKAFDRGDSELVGLRKQLLLRLVQEEVVQQWLNQHQAVKEKAEVVVENVLQLDSPGYHPEDRNFNYYRDIAGKELIGFFGSPNFRHSGAVMACAFSPEGKTLVSASSDHTLKLWDVETGKEIRSFSGHKDAVRGCGFSPQGKTLVSASYDNTLKLWDVETGKEIRSFSG
ncbi:MAG: NACHT domain-containing protein, partial [Candidatus Aminicenantes bacterium]|nr:NACHT domain-containing protein [Candidatus Aminicenantes bacterium]NIM83279.1 NACHT domain-containing protein [Candidatus Aminicenantes bacterium]NIN22650.1 NACHT domain-containing protein [Candidatus Aminicenantes bacterium]NIN46409.1 NACHT domain-containing protein [Candidatus Aminicenantes bacterium]NIN89259.1 NACHT domain-containing protein [Candidatus Aminicenantes bacterium]